MCSDYQVVLYWLCSNFKDILQYVQILELFHINCTVTRKLFDSESNLITKLFHFDKNYLILFSQPYTDKVILLWLFKLEHCTKTMKIDYHNQPLIKLLLGTKAEYTTTSL